MSETTPLRKGLGTTFGEKRQNGSWAVKVELFQIEKVLMMSASFGVFIFKNPHFLQVLNWEKLLKNALLTKHKKKQAIFRKEWEFMRTGLKKSQKTTDCATIKFRRGSGCPFQRAALMGSYPQITGQRPLHLVEPTDIFARSIRESVIVGYTLWKRCVTKMKGSDKNVKTEL